MLEIDAAENERDGLAPIAGADNGHGLRVIEMGWRLSLGLATDTAGVGDRHTPRVSDVEWRPSLALMTRHDSDSERERMMPIAAVCDRP